MPGHVRSRTSAISVPRVPPEERLYDDPVLQRALCLSDDCPLYVSAFVGGLVAAFVSAVLWTLFSTATGVQFACMACVVGVLVGIGIRLTGDGAKREYALLGIMMTLFGCVLGNAAAASNLLAFEPTLSFAPVDVIFYVLALYSALRLARGKSPSGASRTTDSRRSAESGEHA
jgi:hypothetical protein